MAVCWPESGLGRDVDTRGTSSAKPSRSFDLERSKVSPTLPEPPAPQQLSRFPTAEVPAEVVAAPVTSPSSLPNTVAAQQVCDSSDCVAAQHVWLTGLPIVPSRRSVLGAGRGYRGSCLRTGCGRRRRRAAVRNCIPTLPASVLHSSERPALRRAWVHRCGSCCGGDSSVKKESGTTNPRVVLPSVWPCSTLYLSNRARSSGCTSMLSPTSAVWCRPLMSMYQSDATSTVRFIRPHRPLRSTRRRSRGIRPSAGIRSPRRARCRRRELVS